MEEDGETYVLIIVKDEETDIKDVLADNLDSTEIGNIIETAQNIKVDVKLEPEDTYEESASDYIDDDLLEKCDIETELKKETYDPDYDEDDDYDDEDADEPRKKPVPKKYEGLPNEDVKYLIEIKRLTNSNKGPKKYLKRVPKSLVEELRQEYEELRNDDRLLVDTVEQIMRDVKPPDPPRDYFIINGIMYECVECGNFSGTLSAARRHYNEKHGPRYLLCYACGDDFRSSINLYKHEKRCRAPDAHVVLKARAGIVGSKGRGRPFLARARDKPHCLPYTCKTQMKASMFPCSLCSAVFTSKNNMQAHENVHRGERPYRCQHCPRAYTNYSALNRHSKMHTEEQFICDYCSRSCKTKGVLKSHLNTHNPVKKFGCPECSRRYAQKSALRIHIDREHRNLPPPCACEMCPKRYPRMSLLKEHMQKAHGLTIMTRRMFYKKLPTMSDTELKRHLSVQAEF